MTSKCGKNNEVAHEPLASVSLIFFCNLLLNLTRLYYNGSTAKSHSTTTQYRQLRRLHGIYLFYTMIRKKKKTDTHTCLLRLDCSRICASLDIFLTFFKSQALLFVTASSFFLYLNCTVIVNSFFEKFFNVFPCSKHNNGEYILENGESLIAMKHDGSCCEHFL